MLKFSSVDIKKSKLETLVIPVCEDKNIHADRTVAALADKALAVKEFLGKAKDELALYSPARVKCERVLFLGLGKAEDIQAETLRACMGRAIKTCIGRKLMQVAVAEPAVKRLKLDEKEALEALLEGGCLANHMFSKYKSEEKQKSLKKIVFLGAPGSAAGNRKAAGRIENTCAAVTQAREWVSTPANDKRPDAFARQIARAARAKGLTCRVLDEKALKREKFGALLAVADLKPKVGVIGVLPLVENMPSGSATRPGDIVRSYAGKTVEIGNTCLLYTSPSPRD